MYVLHVVPWKSAGWVPPDNIIEDMHARPEERGPKGGKAEEAENAQGVEEPREIRE